MSIPTTTQLRALPYRSTAAQNGMTSGDFRVQMRMHGERVGWLSSVKGGGSPNAQGLSWVLQPLADDVRVFIYSQKEDIQTEEFGLIRKGDIMLSWMPDELQPKRNDRFDALDRPGVPTYELLFEQVKESILGKDGVRLPSWAPLRLLTAGEL